MLSVRSEEVDKVCGLKTGADDYLQKPYGIQELFAWIKLQLLRVDTATRRVWQADREIALGPREFALLLALIERPGKVFDRGALLDQVWERDLDVETRTVDVHIAQSRKALRQFGTNTMILTVRGTNYARD